MQSLLRHTNSLRFKALAHRRRHPLADRVHESRRGFVSVRIPISTIRLRKFAFPGTGAVLLCLLGITTLWGQSPQTPPKDLTTASIEDLMNIEVTSASRKSETLSEAPAAIFVITSEDIRRGSFSSVPDALRIVPGLHVARQSAHIWLVSARGFSNLFNAKMLVLIDGRLAYTPTFGGVGGTCKPLTSTYVTLWSWR